MKIYLDSIGCRLNQSEIEKIGETFRAVGHTLVANAAEADTAIVNTCSVTAKAAADSRKKIRQAYRSGVTKIIATGCWATLEPTAAETLPGVVRVVTNGDKEHLVQQILNIPGSKIDLEPIARQPLPGIHQRTRAFIKAQDGCNNHCTFCITRIARGMSRSTPAEDILADISRAALGDVKEIVLTGVHLAAWGHDFEPALAIKDLVKLILTQTNIPRIRLSSLEPWDLDENFLKLWKNERLCSHLHIPLQSGSAKTMRRMGRKITPEGFAELICNARNVCPEIAITTDIIVGFPGETEMDFSDSLSFVEKMDFAGGHVFAFSPRQGTPAADMVDQVSIEIIKERSEQMRAAFRRAADRYQRQYLQQKVKVLWESGSAYTKNGWLLHGLSSNYLHVSAYSRKQLWNQFSDVLINQAGPDGLCGEILD